MGQREEYTIHRSPCAGHEGCARPDDEAEILNGCHPATHGIHAFLSQESIVHEQPIEKNVNSSDLLFCHSNNLSRGLDARINQARRMPRESVAALRRSLYTVCAAHGQLEQQNPALTW